MLVKLAQLGQRLKQNSLPLIWISGDETLLVQKACDQVRKYALEQDHSECEVIDDAGYDWNNPLLSNNSLSLFADRKLIDLVQRKNKGAFPNSYI